MVDKKPKEIVQLKDKLDFIFKKFDSIFLKKLAKDEKKIDYNNLFFEIEDKSVVKSADFLKEIGTLYDLFVYLLNNSMKLIIVVENQIQFFKVITELKKIILSMKTDIADQSEEDKKKIFAKKGNVFSNVEILLEKRNNLIDQFSKNNIISMGEKFYDAPKKSEESISKKSEQKSDK